MSDIIIAFSIVAIPFRVAVAAAMLRSRGVGPQARQEESHRGTEARRATEE